MLTLIGYEQQLLIVIKSDLSWKLDIFGGVFLVSPSMYESPCLMAFYMLLEIVTCKHIYLKHSLLLRTLRCFLFVEAKASLMDEQEYEEIDDQEEGDEEEACW